MEERHKLLLIKQNPQWNGEKADIPEFERDILSNLERYIENKQLIAIVGLRRVGKTILLKQLIRKIKGERNDVCYISFDDRDFQKYELAYELIDYFLQNSNKNKIRYLFLDEIQKIQNWQDLLKTIYDTESNLKIFISGSSSLELKKYKETLAGRILTFNIPVFTFKEFVRYHGLEHNISPDNLLREYDLKFLKRKNSYQELFAKYLLQGAFPELLEAHDEDYIKKYLDEMISKVIVDISKSIGLEKEREIGELILLFSKSTAREFELNNLASLLKLNRNTVSRYVNILEKTFLIKTSYNYTTSIAKKLRIAKKAYIAHSSIAVAMLNYPFNITNIEGSDFGHLVETVIISNLKDFSFWKHQNHEVDIILKDNTPIEVKYQSQISSYDSKGILKFMEIFKVKKGIILTKNLMEIKKENGKEILFVPAWLFLLTLK